MSPDPVPNFIAGRWSVPAQAARADVFNPSRGERLAQVPLSGPAEVDAAVACAARAFLGWSATPVLRRAAILFRFKQLLEENAAELARLITTENGKTLDEARGDVRRGIEVLEFACGIAHLVKGDLHVQGTEGVQFYTRQRVVLSRWDKTYVRQQGW